MKKIFLAVISVIALSTLCTATIYEWSYSPYSFGQVNDNEWYEGYLGFNSLNNGYIVIDAETIAWTGTASYLYVRIDNGPECTVTGNPVGYSAYTSYETPHTGSTGTTVTAMAFHQIIDGQYGTDDCGTSMTKFVARP